ncbi:hypothetical protein [Salirhabdus salicampi]|uniref:hypothetical protein n=1 Tax=Salirhabdus salicampi TaxID=476102 RepID=UPI0020C39ECC|nr:hypothetical protein [Salirhabdus salicampi]MCP8615295.1 hypothetical protein [Salirhabdus salicampi]
MSDKQLVTSFLQSINEYILFYYLFYILFSFFSALLLPVPYFMFSISILVMYCVSAAIFTSYRPYIVLVPSLIWFSSYFFTSPFFLLSLLVMTLTWRFIVNHNNPFLGNEKKLFLFTSGLGIVCFVIFKEHYFVWIALGQFFLSIFVHLANSYIRSNQQLSVRFASILVSVFALMTAACFIFFILFDGIRASITKVVSVGAAVGIHLASWALQGIDYDPFQQNRSTETNYEGSFQGHGERSEELRELEQQQSTGVSELTILIGQYVLLAICILVLVFIAWKLYKRKVVPIMNLTKTNEHLQHEPIFDESEAPLYKRKRKAKPKDTVRRQFYEFELLTSKSGFGRYHSETIEDWFTRIGLPLHDIHLYEKVRYGEETLSQQEIKKFQQSLQQWKSYIKTRNNYTT